MATARFSCGTMTGRGSLVLLARPRLKASTMGGKSVPGVAKKKSTPCSGSERRKTSAAIGSRAVRRFGSVTLPSTEQHRATTLSAILVRLRGADNEPTMPSGDEEHMAAPGLGASWEDVWITTGIRLAVTPARELKRSGTRYGIASACIG